MIRKTELKKSRLREVFKSAATLMVVGAFVFGSAANAQPVEKPADKPADQKTADQKTADQKPQAPAGGGDSPFLKVPPKKPKIIESAEYEVAWRIERDMPLMYEKKYDEQEKQVESWRKSKEAFSNGEWKLTAFYNGITQFDYDDPGDSTVEYLRKWVAAQPTSITAHVALAQGLVNYAWTARGSGSGSSVSPEQHEIFQERLQEARLVLREAKKLPNKCPHWWAVAQTVALGQGWDRDAYDGLFKEAIAFEPTYNLYYFNKSKFLLSRWYGEVGEPEAFAVEAADYVAKKKGREAGDMLYARIFWFLDHMHATEIDRGLPVVNYERMSNGFQELLKAYPDNIAVKTQWAQQLALSWKKPNMEARRAKARELLNEVDYRVDLWAFHNVEEFMALHNAVFENEEK